MDYTRGDAARRDWRRNFLDVGARVFALTIVDIDNDTIFLMYVSFVYVCVSLCVCIHVHVFPFFFSNSRSSLFSSRRIERQARGKHLPSRSFLVAILARARGMTRSSWVPVCVRVRACVGIDTLIRRELSYLCHFKILSGSLSIEYRPLSPRFNVSVHVTTIPWITIDARPSVSAPPHPVLWSIDPRDRARFSS